MTVYQR